MKKVLFIDDQLDLWMPLLKSELTKHDFEVLGQSSPDHVLDLIKEHRPEVIMLDIMFGDKNLGRDKLKEIKKKYPKLPVMMITTTMDKKEYNTADYKLQDDKYFKDLLQTSDDFLDLANRLNQIIEKAATKKKERETTEILESTGLIVGKTARMREACNTALKVANTVATVLILGESGTGKEMLARTIVAYSDRKKAPFVAINCAAIPDDLIETELFGYDPGAYTDAKKTKLGKFEIADKGTIFLDEIAELKQHLQAKILRVSQEKEIERVGGTKPIKVDIRIIAATNKNLYDEVKRGAFREDLYYRLNTVTIQLPALRDRKEDLKTFFDHFVKRHSQEYSKRVSPKLRDDVLERFQAYSWPGNIRQFENVMKKAIILTSNQVLQLEDFKNLEDEDQNNVLLGSQNDIILKLWNRKITLENLNEAYKQKSLTPIIKGLVDKWLSENRVRPKHKELADLLDTTESVMRQIFKKCKLKLTKDWPKISK